MNKHERVLELLQDNQNKIRAIQHARGQAEFSATVRGTKKNQKITIPPTHAHSLLLKNGTRIKVKIQRWNEK